MRLPHVNDLENADVVVIGLPFDTAASFGVGCRFAPEAIRRASAVLRPFHSDHRIDVFSYVSAIDYGDVAIVPGFVEESLELIRAGLEPVCRSGAVPISFGGDHSVALAELRAITAAHGPVALVLFDSHPDTYESFRGHLYFHSTPFRRAVEEGLVDVSHSIICGLRGPTFGPDDWADPMRLGFDVVTAAEMHRMSSGERIARILGRVTGMPTFLSFDVDFLDPAFAPGTGTPETGGFATWETQELIRGLGPLRLVGADVVEVLPAADVGGITALAAANIAFEFISLVALRLREDAPAGPA